MFSTECIMYIDVELCGQGDVEHIINSTKRSLYHTYMDFNLFDSIIKLIFFAALLADP